ANIDIPATIMDWARQPIPPGVEGRSLAPLLGTTPIAQSAWRNDLLVEYWDNTNPLITLMPTYQGVRVENNVESALYVKHDTGEEEFYDGKKDPWQLDSAVAGNPVAVSKYFERTKTLAACRGTACR
ncbi:MAG: sulfatase/phosphatase domain-containing protein, partial [Vicinamibacteria bacterium]